MSETFHHNDALQMAEYHRLLHRHSVTVHACMCGTEPTGITCDACEFVVRVTTNCCLSDKD